MFEAKNGEIKNKRYYNQDMICDELTDFYKKLISVTKDHAFMALRGSIIQTADKI